MTKNITLTYTLKWCHTKIFSVSFSFLQTGVNTNTNSPFANRRIHSILFKIVNK